MKQRPDKFQIRHHHNHIRVSSLTEGDHLACYGFHHCKRRFPQGSTRSCSLKHQRQVAYFLRRRLLRRPFPLPFHGAGGRGCSTSRRHRRAKAPPWKGRTRPGRRRGTPREVGGRRRRRLARRSSRRPRRRIRSLGRSSITRAMAIRPEYQAVKDPAP